MDRTAEAGMNKSVTHKLFTFGLRRFSKLIYAAAAGPRRTLARRRGRGSSRLFRNKKDKVQRRGRKAEESQFHPENSG